MEEKIHHASMNRRFGARRVRRVFGPLAIRRRDPLEDPSRDVW
jgi:hypothetical protein